MFLDIQIDLIILKTYDQQFTFATKKSLHIIFNHDRRSYIADQLHSTHLDYCNAVGLRYKQQWRRVTIRRQRSASVKLT